MRVSPRHPGPSPARNSPVSATAPSRRVSTLFPPDAGRASFPTAARGAGRAKIEHGLRPNINPARPPCSTASSHAQPSAAPAPPGRSIRATTFAHGPVRCHRGAITHSILHPRVRGITGPLYELVPRQSAGALASASVRVLRGSTSPTRCFSKPRADRARAAAAHVSGWGRSAQCRPLRACAGAACRRRRCANSSAPIGVSRRRTVSSTSPCSRHAIRDVLNRTAAAPGWRLLRPLKVVDRELPRKGGRKSSKR